MIARSRSHLAIHPLVLLVALSAILLVPVFGAVAQSDPVRTSPTETPSGPDGFQAESTEEPTREPEPPPTESPDAPTEEAQPAAPSSLTLHKGACDDSNFDPYATTGLDNFLAACASPDGEFEFTVFNDVAFNTTQSTELGTLFMQLPTGPVTISETLPDGWGDPAVFCWSNLFPAPSPQPFIGNNPTWNVAEGEDVECWWFNIAAGTGNDDAPDNLLDPGLQEGEAQLAHDITITKRTCPAGTDPTQGLDAYQNLCPTTAGIEFTLEFGAGATSTTTTNENGEISWLSVADGPFEIRETNHAAYAQQIAFCHYDGIGAPWQGTVIDGAMAGTFDMGLPPGTGSVHLFCDWINIESDTTATLTIIKHRCPLGVPEDTTLDQYLVICAELFDGVQFTLEHSGQSFPGETANGGQAEWPDVPAGPITLVETNPGGYKDPRVFCHFFQGEQELLFGQEEFSIGGDIAITVPHDATEVLCYVINIPDPDLATSLTVNKLRCTPSFDKETDDPTVACQTPLDGVTFTLGDLESTSGEAVPGQASFINIPVGDHQLSEVPSDSIAYAFIGGCTRNGVAVPLLVPAVEFPSLDITIEAGDHWVCEWYNVPKPVARIVINKRICDPGVNFILSDENSIGDVINACPTEGNGIEFTLDTAEGSSTQAIESGATFWDGAPVGPLTITEHIPAGYGEGVWYCETNTVDENGDPVPSPIEQVAAPGGVLATHLNAEYYEVLNCWVFNLQVDTGNLTVMKWNCPPGYDVHAEGANPEADCAEPANGVEFQFGQPGLGTEAVLQETGEIIDGGVRFTSLDPGGWQLVEFAPEGIESAFIGSCIINGEPVPGDPPLHEGFEWDVDIEAAQTTLCHWYNVPNTGSSITIEKYLCPAEYDFDAPMSNPPADCTAHQNGISFNLDDGNPPAPDQSRQTGDDGPGTVVFTDLEPGTWTVTEELPAGIVDARAFCPTITDNPQTFNDPPRAIFEVAEGEHYSCLWFNVPEGGEENNVTIRKWQCPEGTSPDQTQDWYEANCLTQHDGVEFEISSDIGVIVLETTGGTAAMGPFPMSHVEIQENIPAGFGPPVVFCMMGEGGWQPFAAPAGFWEFSFDDDGITQTMICHVYNIPGGDNDILIHKWLCPEDFNPMGVSDQEFFDTCTTSLDGITFKALSDLGIAVLDTTGGQVGFGGFPTGMDVGIQEEIPPEYGNPYVICEFDDGQWHDVGAQSGFFEIYFAASDETVECHVFNIPGEEPDLTILKWTCPEGYDLHAWGADPHADCTQATNGVEFELRYSGHDEVEQSQVTGDLIDGGVIFEDLQPDTYHVTEIVPAGIDSVFVLECTGHVMGMLQPYPLEAGNVLDDIDLDAGEHLICHWFNVPEDDGGSLTVIKYTCSTETFVSKVDCEIEEEGVTFDLLYWNPGLGTWDVIDTEVTDGVGRITWLSLEAGDYSLDEHGGDWCHLETSPVFGPGDGFSITDGNETVVEVYNCDGTPGILGETPTKYPNTGVPQQATPILNLGRTHGQHPLAA